MTQKELLYFEDAVGHEKALLQICEHMKESFENEDLISFIEEEITMHTNLKENLMNILEEKANE